MNVLLSETIKRQQRKREHWWLDAQMNDVIKYEYLWSSIVASNSIFTASWVKASAASLSREIQKDDREAQADKK